jgi:hypothetical protein
VTGVRFQSPLEPALLVITFVARSSSSRQDDLNLSLFGRFLNQ